MSKFRKSLWAAAQVVLITAVLIASFMVTMLKLAVFMDGIMALPQGRISLAFAAGQALLFVATVVLLYYKHLEE